MFLGGSCGQLGVGGWVLMGLFWATFLGLVLWALSRLFAPAHGDDELHETADDPSQLGAQGPIDLSDSRTPREELTASARQRDMRTH